MATCDVNILKSALGIQQTGPRTVIVPADPIIWDESTSYEYLTLVASTDFGQGYVSKKDVPAGTPLTNDEYWVPVASFNAQLSSIQSSISTINEELAGKAPTNHASSQPTYGTATNETYGHVKLTDDAGTSGVNSGVATTPAAVNATIESSRQNRMVVIGDSYSAEDYVSTTGAWWQYVADAMGLEPHCFAIGGTGFVVGGSNSFKNQVITAASQVEPSTVDWVFVFGGLNDYGNYTGATNFQSAVQDTLNQARTSFPHSKIVLVGSNTWQNIHASTSAQGNDSDYWRTVQMADAAATSHAMFISTLYAIWGNTNNFQSGNQHPSAQGQKQLGKYIIQQLMGGLGGDFYQNPLWQTTTNDGNVTVSCSMISGIHKLEIVISGEAISDSAVTISLPFTTIINPLTSPTQFEYADGTGVPVVFDTLSYATATQIKLTNCSKVESIYGYVLF